VIIDDRREPHVPEVGAIAIPTAPQARVKRRSQYPTELCSRRAARLCAARRWLGRNAAVDSGWPKRRVRRTGPPLGDCS
jgi:hypothetical protein